MTTPAATLPSVTAATNPLRAVLAAFESGCATLTEVSRRSGLDRDLVDAAVDHLVRTGRLVAGQLSTGCPSTGCGGCASGVEGRPGCGAPTASSERTVPVLVTLTLAPAPR